MLVIIGKRGTANLYGPILLYVAISIDESVNCSKASNFILISCEYFFVRSIKYSFNSFVTLLELNSLSSSIISFLCEMAL